jgi:CheY-like chemotaxis protein
MALYLPLLSKRLTDPKCEEIVDAIKGSCDSMGGLLNALLDISKLDAGVVEPKVVSVATLPLFRSLEREFALQAEEKGIALRVIPVERTISTDPTLIERILRNLLANAVRHTARGRVLLGARRHGLKLRFEIWDSGIGIEESQLDGIFQEFYQVGNPERDRHQGLGLGLAIVERLARLLDHRLAVRSKPGKGSVFSVEVPLISAEPYASKSDSTSVQCRLDLNGKLVVLIDDDGQVLKASTKTLEEWDCDVISAETIGAALTKIEQHGRRPDLILADFRLRGEETGLMAVDLINQFVGRKVPAVIITGDTDPRRIREATQGGYPLLHKPVQAEKLRAVVESELNTDRPVPA